MIGFNIPYLRRGIKHWVNDDDNWIRFESEENSDFFFDEFSVNEILKASYTLYEKIAEMLLNKIEECSLRNQDNKSFQLIIDKDIVVDDSILIDDVVNKYFSKKRHYEYSREYKKLCYYISACANIMFGFEPMSGGFSVKLMEEIGDDYIFIAGVSKNPKYKNMSYNNNIYVITHKWNRNLIDFYTSKRENYDYDEFYPYPSIVDLWANEQFTMNFMTVDLIEDEKQGLIEFYSGGGDYDDEQDDDYDYVEDNDDEEDDDYNYAEDEDYVDEDELKEWLLDLIDEDDEDIIVD